MFSKHYYKQKHTQNMDPRISFSNDFADSTQHQQQQQLMKPRYESNYREAPVSSDFEFSVKDFTLIPADEIFFKGVMVPLKEDLHHQGRRMTLREELMVDVDRHGQLPRVPTKVSSGWWKEKLGGLKRGHSNNNNGGGKRGERNNHGDGGLERIEEKRASSFVHGDRLSLGSAN